MRKTENKLIVVLLAVVFALAIFEMQTEPAFAAEVQAFGNCGTDVTWTYDSDGVLTISGSGAMEDYANPAAPPYMGNDIVRLVVEEGVTGIGANAFGGLFLDYVMLPESLTSIGQNAFDGAAIDEAHFAGNLKQWRENVSVGTGNDALTSKLVIDADVAYECISNDGSHGFNLHEGTLLIWDTRDFGGNYDSINNAYNQFDYPELSSFKTEYNEYILHVSFDMQVTRLPSYICADLTFLQTAAIPEGVLIIPTSGFSGCTNLVSVSIPDSITVFEEYAFYGCSSLAAITIPDGVTEIGTQVFRECTSLTTVTIPGSVTDMGVGVFQGCICLTRATLSEGISSLGNSIFYGCRNLTNIIIPNGVKCIPESAFSGCENLISASIPNSVTSIDKDAFRNCFKLASIVIPEGVTSIGDSAFFCCSELTSIILPDGVVSIGDNAFFSCDLLASVSLPDTLTHIGRRAFSNCSFTSIVIPDGITSIEDGTFSSCVNLASVTIPAGVTSIGSGAFDNCESLASIYYDGTALQWPMIRIDSDANEALNNATVHYPYDAGKDGDIAWVVRKSGLLKIGGSGAMTDYLSASDAPWNASSNHITGLTVSTRITDIGKNAFSGLSSLTTVESLGKVKTIGDNAFSGCTSLTAIPLPDTLTAIGENAFAGCTALDTISIGSRVTSIGQNAFHGCSHLTTAGVAGSGAAIEFGWRTAIPANAFSGADYLQSITIPEGVTRIMKGALQNCTSLTTVNLPSSLKTIYADVFKGCTALANISIPSGVTSIGSDALAGCTALTRVVVNSANTVYSSESGILFNKNKTELILYPAKKTGTDYEIPETVETVAGNAFSANTYLTQITIHETMTSIGDGAFNGCTAITDVWYDSTDTKWNSINIGSDNAPLVNAQLHAAHEYGEPIWDWADDYSTADAIFICLNGDSTQRVAAVITSETEPATCELGDAIIYTATVTFEETEYTGTAVDEHGAALGHDWPDWTVKTVATCIAEGEETRTCSRCGKTETRVIDMLAHTPAEAVEENRVDPTCTEAGEYDQVVYCSACGHELSREHTVLDPLDHDWGEWTVTTAPTCTSQGEETRTCSRHDAIETREVAMLAHTLGEAVEENRTEPDCEAAGSYDMVVRCTACGTEISRSKYSIDATGHNYTVFYEWSSDNSSVIAFAICANNSRHVVTETVTVTAEVTKPATEYEVGETTYTAVFTNSVFETQTKVLANIDKLPHPYKVGDANDDGTVGTVDRVLLSRYLAGWPDILPLIKDINMMDINSDRTVNAKDRVILSRYIANWGEPYNSYFAQ